MSYERVPRLCHTTPKTHVESVSLPRPSQHHIYIIGLHNPKISHAHSIPSLGTAPTHSVPTQVNIAERQKFGLHERHVSLSRQG